MKKAIVFFIFLLLLTNFFLYASNQRGLVTVNEDKNNREMEIPPANLQSLDTFKNIIPQNTYADLVHYITNKGNIYTETLATTKNDREKGPIIPESGGLFYIDFCKNFIC